MSMTEAILESLKRVSENVTRVYQSGVAVGLKRAGEVVENEFWDGFTNSGNRTEYARAFAYWGCEYIRPTRKIIPTTSDAGLNTFAHNTNLKKVEAAYFDFSQKPRGTGNQSGYYYTFYNCKALEEIEDIGMQADYCHYNSFRNCDALHTIAKIRCDENTSFTEAFTSSNRLENITFEGTIGQNLYIASPKLSNDSISNIVSCLSDTASGKTLTLSQTAVDNAGFGQSIATITMFTPGGGNTGIIHSEPITLSAGQSIKVDWDWKCLTPAPEDGSSTTTFSGIFISKDGGVSGYNLQNNIFTATEDGTYCICWSFSMYTDHDMTDELKAKAFLVDAEGEEITGENLCHFTTEGAGDFAGSLNYLITSIKETTSFEDLIATKPNWTITLV